MLKVFTKNLFILDEHRSILVPMQMMKYGRADHSVLYFKGNIYVFGGMSFSNDERKAKNVLETQNTCEVYSISKD